MSLFKDIVSEAIVESQPWSTVKRVGGQFYMKTDMERASIVFNNEKQPIYSLKEMSAEFRERYLAGGQEATLASVENAYKDGFFKRWIPTNTINKAMRTRGRANKGEALEFLVGKKRDSGQFSDLPDAELKAYDESAGYHELFMLTPYNFEYWEPDFGYSFQIESDKELNDLLVSFKEKIKAKAQTKWINTKDYTEYETVTNEAFAKAIIEVDDYGKSAFNEFEIGVEFFGGVDEDGEPISLGFIVSRYRTDDTEDERLYRGKRGNLRQTLPQAVGNKIFTILSFPTRSLTIRNKGVTNYKVLPNDRKIYNEFYQYTEPSVHKMRMNDTKGLVLNFIEAINSGDIIVSFGFDENLRMKAKFLIKNRQESYDKLFNTGEEMRIVYGGDDKAVGESSRIEPMVLDNQSQPLQQNDNDTGYTYEGELHDEGDTNRDGFIVSKVLYPYGENGPFKKVYNVENDSKELVFPVWFDSFETDEVIPNGKEVLQKDRNAFIIGYYMGNRFKYLLNWVTGEMERLNVRV